MRGEMMGGGRMMMVAGAGGGGGHQCRRSSRGHLRVMMLGRERGRQGSVLIVLATKGMMLMLLLLPMTLLKGLNAMRGAWRVGAL